jgi:hypothetical protein
MLGRCVIRPVSRLPVSLSLGFVPCRVPNPFSSSLQDCRSSPLFSPSSRAPTARTPPRSPEPGPHARLPESECAAVGTRLLEQPVVAEPTHLDGATACWPPPSFTVPSRSCGLPNGPFLSGARCWVPPYLSSRPSAWPTSAGECTPTLSPPPPPGTTPLPRRSV